jgi:voltage-gated potassium channel
MQQFLRDLYNGDTVRAHRFRFGLLGFDLATILFLIATSFAPRTPVIETLDIVVGTIIVVDFLARLWTERSRLRFLLHPYGIADLVVIASLLAPLAGEGLAFLRVVRVFRLLRSYQLLRRLRQDFRFFRRHEATVTAGLNLAIFMFLMTAIVYETQHFRNERIATYLDALYFTVTTLTTTGYGDITLVGESGKLIAVIIMIFGISLFIRLVQVVLRPAKAHHKCPTCGLTRHDHDAVHCKACGQILNIEDEGLD